MALTKQLNTLEYSGLIRLAQVQPELEYLFRHALVQEAAYGSLLREDRRRLHLVVGETLERLYPHRLGELAPMLARHFDEAGDKNRALNYFILAGDNAAQQYANSEALTQYSRALEIGRQGVASSEQLTDIYSHRGRVLEVSGKYEDALANYVEMEALAVERGDPSMELAALTARATIHSIPTATFDVEQGQALADRAFRLAREIGDRKAEAKNLWNLMNLSLFTQRPVEALEYGERSMTIARELDLREQLAFTLNDINTAYMARGEVEGALSVLAEARQIWSELGNIPMLTDTLSTSASVHLMSGNYEQAFALAKEAYRLSRSIDNLWGQSYSLLWLGYVYLERGELDQAIRAFENAIVLGDRVGFGGGSVVGRGWLAEVYGTIGAVEPALELVRAALDTSNHKFPFFTPIATAGLVRLQLLDGNLTEAEATMQRARESNQPPVISDLIWSGDVAIAEGELAMARHNYERAVTVLDDYIDALRQTGSHFDPARLLFAKGKALLLQGRSDEARQVLEEARAEAEAIGSRRTLWQILFTLSKIEDQLGNSAGAHVLRQRAREIVEYILSHIPTEELRASFLELPQVRALREPNTI